MFLVAARFVTGVSAAFTAPAGLSIITTTFREGPARNRALAIYTATAASGFSFGLVFGGLLTSVDWRLTFAVAAPVGSPSCWRAAGCWPTTHRRHRPRAATTSPEPSRSPRRCSCWCMR